ncbi:peptidylprolyl isomerase [Pontimicrobium sp. SW4]|uniref:Peptidyl-prolyl cis-trans isomerase n=1 Tax=Pontimicrobium sp. SW4 TaxID=3153519 RepID=A0AAU7BUF5_9FLAO
MKNSQPKLFKIVFILFLVSFYANSQNNIQCKIETSLGDIIVELYPEKAPITVSNFMKYVDNNLYENSTFFRVCTPENEAKRDIKIQVIQGGFIDNSKSFDPIVLETTNDTKLLHKNGTISMARSSANTATSSFFICINDQPELDFAGKRHSDDLGFAAFGKVTKGMDIVLKIQSGDNKNQQLLNPIEIKNIYRITKN